MQFYKASFGLLFAYRKTVYYKLFLNYQSNRVKAVEGAFLGLDRQLINVALLYC